MEDTYQDISMLREYVTLQGITLSVWVYYIDGMLVDTGSKTISAQVQAFTEKYRPEQVLITHLHEDHYGMAGWMQQEKGLPVYIHPMSVQSAVHPPVLPRYRELFWGNPASFYPQPLGAEHETNRYRFHVIETPGHASDHVALFDAENGRLFSGDLFLGSKVKICMRGESMPALMDSVRRVLELDFDTLFCAHAGIIPNGKQRLREKLSHLEEIEHTIKEKHRQGWNLREITRFLYPRRPPIYHLSYGEWSPIHIVHSFFQSISQQNYNAYPK
ncbi:MBL fold metallo-hydrolase [Aneurinibacillus migulanus]|uniref:Glyoxylase, beta-lactamase superfamily II n=1 Tax=Aneurinibacillus migulanus TaxID=47500 RepID=A0A0M0HC33_ANEMI|nr:MBL fold metallo-hydrolase [Aneurinibacillus migulanus]KON99291.1 hypothetical protein AF333_00715 [Aneurinibacillus migulanus]MED0893270.1 MBL fold metallo-hydrolase [Aneurinibacillus migulanus]MED1615425.1 MBL fold metallo-hydrolase [Aneurinibacillus migulanus]SDI57021.1 Glyoxylase, beta-lactamase superfamily II [Aneurinibacillus migulanus]GED14612.1 MBL fold hydrolase [Aneurinibacillus migulanus]